MNLQQIKEELSGIPAAQLWGSGALLTTVIAFVITFVVAIFWLPLLSALIVAVIVSVVMTVVFVTSLWDSMFVSVDPDTVLVTKDKFIGEPGFLKPGLNLMHPLRPLTGERISLKVVTFSIEKITMECEGGVRLKTSLTVSFQPDVDNLTNFYLQTGAGSGDLDIIKSVTKKKVSSMMAIVNSYKYKDVLGEKQNEIIKKIQGAFDDSANFTDPDDTARQESARKLEVDTGIQILRIDFGDIDHEDPKIAETASQKMMNKMIKESAEEFKDIPKDDIENALMAAGKVKGFIIRGGSGIEAAQLERSVGRVD